MAALSPDVWRIAFAFLPDDLLAVRCTCKEWRALLGEEHRPCVTRKTVQNHLETAGPLDWLWAAVTTSGDPDGPACILFLYVAETRGLEEAGKLMGQWASFNTTLFEMAAEEGLLKAMRRLEANGGESNDEEAAFRLDGALHRAAGQNQTEAMELLKSWGATDFDSALNGAAEEGQLEAMELLKKWGADEFDNALTFAAESGRLEAMKLLKKWGATSFRSSFTLSAEEGRLEAMKLLKKWGATDFNLALIKATAANQIGAMHLLREWGATDLRAALVWAEPEPRALLEKWLAERAARRA